MRSQGARSRPDRGPGTGTGRTVSLSSVAGPITLDTAIGNAADHLTLIAVAGTLSPVFSNDIVCLAMTPVVARLCLQRRLDPLPFLVGLACAANIGSAATLIGNPQNMLIGSIKQLHFGDYLRQALPPVLISLAGLWAWLAYGPRRPAPCVMRSVGQTERQWRRPACQRVF